jgi:hypothetical protein
MKSALFRGARTAFAKRQQLSRKGPKNHASYGVWMGEMMIHKLFSLVPFLVKKGSDLLVF